MRWNNSLFVRIVFNPGKQEEYTCKSKFGKKTGTEMFSESVRQWNGSPFQRQVRLSFENLTDLKQIRLQRQRLFRLTMTQMDRSARKRIEISRKTAGNRSSEKWKAVGKQISDSVSNCKSVFRNANSGKKETWRKKLVITQTKRIRRFSDSMHPVHRQKERFVLPNAVTSNEFVHYKQTHLSEEGFVRPKKGNPVRLLWQHNNRAGVGQWKSFQRNIFG